MFPIQAFTSLISHLWDLRFEGELPSLSSCWDGKGGGMHLLFDVISSRIVSETDKDQLISTQGHNSLTLCLITYICGVYMEKDPIHGLHDTVAIPSCCKSCHNSTQILFLFSSHFLCFWLQIFRLAQFFPNSLATGHQGFRSTHSNDPLVCVSCLCVTIFTTYLFHLSILSNTGFPTFTLDKALEERAWIYITSHLSAGSPAASKTQDPAWPTLAFLGQCDCVKSACPSPVFVVRCLHIYLLRCAGDCTPAGEWDLIGLRSWIFVLSSAHSPHPVLRHSINVHHVNE